MASASSINGADNEAFGLALLVAGGGLFGFIKSGSVPSVVAGLTVGALYGFGGLRMRQGEDFGVESALLASVILAGSSLPRAIRTQKPLPLGLSFVAIYGLYRFGSLKFR